MKRIFLLEAIDLAVMGRGQAITLPIDSGEILLSLDRQALAGEARATPPALEPVQELSPTEVAQRLGLQPRTILKRIERGALRAHRRGKRWMISPAELTAESMPLRQPRRRTIRGTPKRKDFFTQSLARRPDEITIGEAAKRLHVSRSAVYQHVRAGSFPGRQLGKGGPWVLPKTVSWRKKGKGFKLSKDGRRIVIGSFPCPRCRKIWRSKLALATHVNRTHTKSVRVPGQRR